MALVECKECGHLVSTDVKVCMHCGAKLSKPMGRLKLMFVLVASAIVVNAFFDQHNETKNAPPKPAKTAEEIKKEQEEERRFQNDVLLVRLLQRSLKNPESFQFVDATSMKDGTLCITYRGTNSFNAIVTEHAAISALGEHLEWNRKCANKTGVNRSYLKHAL